jgi:hypothetical protein
MRTITPAAAAEIRRMIGDVDDAVINSIERTGASAAQVLEAVQWFRGGGGLEDEIAGECDRVDAPAGKG